MTEPTASASIEIAAAPEHIYALLTNLDTFTEISAETSRMVWKKGSSAEPGARFAGTNDNGKRKWSTKSKITDADGARFAFEVTSVGGTPVSRWQYDIEPTPTGARVTESTWDKRPFWFKKVASIATASPNRPAINARNIQATLAKLKARAEAG
jgi:hypothetical protein